MHRSGLIIAALLLVVVAWVEPLQAQIPRPALERSVRATVRVVALDSANNPVSAGTGVIIDPRGWILTNFHVVGALRDGSAGRLYGPVVRIDTVADRRSSLRAAYFGTVIQGDARWDLALIRLIRSADGRPLPATFPHLRLRREIGEPGEAIAALGFPAGVQSIEITHGHVTSLIRTALESLASWLRLDARINLGSSGGPIIDRRGQLVALATAIDIQSAQAVELARPIQAVPEAWVSSAANQSQSAQPITGVSVLDGAWRQDVAGGVSTHMDYDVFYYRVQPGLEQRVETSPPLALAVVDTAGRVLAQGTGSVVVPTRSIDLAVRVLIPNTRSRLVSFQIRSISIPVQPRSYRSFVVTSTMPGLPSGTECSVAVMPVEPEHQMRCRMVVECRGLVVYGAGNTGYNPQCDTNETQEVVLVRDLRDDDGDPAMTFDLVGGRVEMRTREWMVVLGASPPAPEFVLP